MAFRSGTDPYRQLFVEKPGIPFNYPPSSIALLMPVTFFPPIVAEVLLTFLSLISLWISIRIVLKRSGQWSWGTGALFFLFATQTFPVKFTLVLGQINLIVLGLTLLAVDWYGRHLAEKRGIRWYIASALILSVGAGLKLFPLYLLPLFLLRGDVLYVALVTLCFGALNIMTSWPLTWEYVTVVLRGLVSFGPPAFYDQSIYAMLLRINGSFFHGQIPLITVLILCVYAYILVRSRRHSRSGQSLIGDAALVLALASIGNSFSWQHHLVFCYPLIMLFVLRFWSKDVTWHWMGKSAVTGSIWFLLFSHAANEQVWWLRYPWLASYQTELILCLIVASLFWRVTGASAAARK